MDGSADKVDYGRVTLTGRSQAQVNSWLLADLSTTYSYATNNQAYKGDISPLIGLLLWPQTDNAKDYLSASGSRRWVSLSERFVRMPGFSIWRR